MFTLPAAISDVQSKQFFQAIAFRSPFSGASSPHLKSPALTKPGSACYLLSSTTCIACSDAARSVTVNPKSRHTNPRHTRPHFRNS